MKVNATTMGAFFGGAAVIAGAFGAHALKDVLSVEQLQSFNTGVRYQMWHALALLALPLLKLNSKTQKSIFWCFCIGIILFSFSIYLLTLSPLFSGHKWTWLGPITPIGGLFLISGWMLLLLSQLKKRSRYT